MHSLGREPQGSGLGLEKEQPRRGDRFSAAARAAGAFRRTSAAPPRLVFFGTS
jgi:hypothetical protein